MAARLFRVIFLLVLLLTFLGDSGESQGLEIKGIVTGRDGVPRGGASIQLSGRQRHIAMTNAMGEFFLRGVAPGEYMVTIVQGDKMQKFPVQVTGGNLNLRVSW